MVSQPVAVTEIDEAINANAEPPLDWIRYIETWKKLKLSMTRLIKKWKVSDCGDN